MQTNTYTKTSFMILPLYGKTIYFYGTDYINSYLIDLEENTYIGIEFKRPISDENSVRGTEWLTITKYFHKKVAKSDSELYIMRIPESFRNDLVAFKNGKYSQFSLAYKKKLLSFYSEDSNMPIVLNPTKEKLIALADKLGVDATLIFSVGEMLSKPKQEEIKLITDYNDTYYIGPPLTETD